MSWAVNETRQQERIGLRGGHYYRMAKMTAEGGAKCTF